MTFHSRESVFLKYAEIFATDHSTKSLVTPLKDHAQLPVLIDILSRKEHHHVILHDASSEKVNHALMQALSQQLATDSVPKMLREAHFIYFDIHRFALTQESIEYITLDFAPLSEKMAQTGKQIIFVANAMDLLFHSEANLPLKFISEWIKSYVLSPEWRFILLTDALNIDKMPTSLGKQFVALPLQKPTDTEAHAILHAHREKFEQFHHVIIPDDILTNALTLSHFYFSSHHYIEHALKILDSASAKTSVYERTDQSGQPSKPVLTNAILASVISNWTRIPLHLLHHNKFKATKFFQAMQKRICGQDAAINLIAATLQHASLKLSKKQGPLASFLFAGPSEVGKTEMAYALTEQLYGNDYALLRLTPTEMGMSDPHFLDTLQVSTELGTMFFLEAIEKWPYAVILIENIQQNTIDFMKWFKPIFVQGSMKNKSGKKHYFHHAIFIVTTALGSEKISALTPAPHLDDPVQSVDLMQLVLNDTPANPVTSHSFSHLTPQEISEDMTQNLSHYFSADLMRELHVVPFMTLDYQSIEKIVRLKLNALGKRLQAEFGIELSYTPEIIRFLVQEVLWRKENKSMKKLLEQHLYTCVAHEVLSHVDDKNRPRQFTLQLNANGQLLKCEAAAEQGTIYKS